MKPKQLKKFSGVGTNVVCFKNCFNFSVMMPLFLSKTSGFFWVQLDSAVGTGRQCFFKRDNTGGGGETLTSKLFVKVFIFSNECTLRCFIGRGS